MFSCRAKYNTGNSFCNVFCSSVGYFFLERDMLKCHLSKIMGEKRLKISDVARDTGINRGTITRIYNEEATRVELEVVEQLCAYLDIEVGQLYEFIKAEEQ